MPTSTPPTRILLGPGPSNVHPRVLRALATPLIGHLDPAFIELMEETKRLLRATFLTANTLTLPISATGSAGMEACLVNLLEPGDTAIVGVNGVFGTRMADIVERCGATPVRVEAPWGRIIEPDAVAAGAARMRRRRSWWRWCTPRRRPAPGSRSKRSAAWCATPTRSSWSTRVTSLGGCPLRVDDWLIDACYSGTQKCLSCPPGLAPLTFGPRAIDALRRRRTQGAELVSRSQP